MNSGTSRAVVDTTTSIASMGASTAETGSRASRRQSPRIPRSIPPPDLTQQGRRVTSSKRRRRRPRTAKMSRINSPHEKRIPQFFITQADGSLQCPTCSKAKRRCMVWNEATGTRDYRVRPLNAGEYLVVTSHDEIGPVRLVVCRRVVHGYETEVLAEKNVCAGGVLLITGWSSWSVRSYRSRIPGRILSGRRHDWAPRRVCRSNPPQAGGRSRGRGRQAPLPLEFN